MSYLLDTCVLSEATKPRPDEGVVAWLREASPETLHVSVISLGELEHGIERLKTGARKAALRRWLTDLREQTGSRLLPVDPYPLSMPSSEPPR